MAPGGELARLLAELQPDELALRDWVAPLLDASMVDELAAADYGDDVEEHRRGIRSLLTVERLPERLDWHPSEVLELVRWSMPEDPTWKPGSPGRTGQEPADLLAPLVDSALHLDPAAVRAALRFLAWCRLQEPGDWSDDPTAIPFLTFALLLLQAASPPPDVDTRPRRHQRIHRRPAGTVRR
jgi:hypothetical protein